MAWLTGNVTKGNRIFQENSKWNLRHSTLSQPWELVQNSKTTPGMARLIGIVTKGNRIYRKISNKIFGTALWAGHENWSKFQNNCRHGMTNRNCHQRQQNILRKFQMKSSARHSEPAMQISPKLQNIPRHGMTHWNCHQRQQHIPRKFQMKSSARQSMPYMKISKTTTGQENFKQYLRHSNQRRPTELGQNSTFPRHGKTHWNCHQRQQNLQENFKWNLRHGTLSQPWELIQIPKQLQAWLVFGGPVPGLEKNWDWTGPGLVRTGKNEPEKTADRGPVLSLIYFWNSTDSMTTGHDRSRPVSWLPRFLINLRATHHHSTLSNHHHIVNYGLFGEDEVGAVVIVLPTTLVFYSNIKLAWAYKVRPQFLL